MMNHGLVSQAPAAKPGKQPLLKPQAKELSVFEFIDYREYLKQAFELKNSQNAAFTESAFVRKAGLSQNSRGYFKLVIQNRRNLTPLTTRGFSEALGLNSKESIYFENLVNFNQAVKAKDKDYYFQRLMAASEGSGSKQFELLRSQYSYCSHWYVVAVRELVGLSDFKEDPAWIAQQLRNKITKSEAAEALIHLERLGLIERAESGRYVQSQPLLKYQGGLFNHTIQRFHLEMIERAKESLLEDEYGERRASALTLSCDHDNFDEMVRMVDEFREKMNARFGVGSKKPSSVFQVCFQIFQLTPVPKREKRK